MKNNNYSHNTLLIVALVLSSCQKKPTACFEISSSKIETGQSVSITNCSTDGSSYIWDFGDGNTSSSSDPKYHVYYSSGAYNVTLTVASKNEKKTDKISKSITVEDPNKKFLGTYIVSRNCTLIGTYNNYSMTLEQGPGGITSIKTSSLLGGTFWVEFYASGGNTFTYNNTGGTTTDETGHSWEVKSLNATLSGNTLTMSFTLDDSMWSNQYGTITCSATAIKQ